MGEEIVKIINWAVAYFSKYELMLWLGSMLAVLATFFIFDRTNYLTLIASIIGVTSLIFCAKGNPIGPFLMIIFSILYGIISFSLTYYGEMVTYVGMTLPMSALSLISWRKNPYAEDKVEVAVSCLTTKDWVKVAYLTIAVSIVFYFILKYFNTAYLNVSTISVGTSFAAAYLTYKRSPYYAIGYAINDLVLIILWILAAIEDISYLSVLMCFVIFFINDLYGYINWKRMEQRQTE
ncbi:MAG: nicotinamide mononucleotide transporter [Epulopiscium sp. Nuni2H_MBin003]|nr:MAG: nicotinamide mononucleotide transporter [Epulopiscium sp. Nuni2H_MBin003]